MLGQKGTYSSMLFFMHERRGNKKTHILLQDVSDDKAENEDGDNGIGGIKDGVTILSISLSTVLTYGIMLIFYKLKYFKLNQQGQNGGNIPVNWK